jgi:hypothetical protein
MTFAEFDYHLKVIGDLIENNDDKYSLTKRGRIAAKFLKKTPEKTSFQLTLRTTDAAILGSAGFALTIANPVFWSGILFTVLGLSLSPPFFYLTGILWTAYSVIVPGAAMWLLTVRRTGAHKLRDVFKPSLACFALLLIPLSAMFALNADLTGAVASTSLVDGFAVGVNLSFSRLLLWGLVFSFLSVAAAECVSFMRKRIAT